MDPGKIFVLILTGVAIGILVYLELKSRRSRQDPQRLPSEANGDKTRTLRKP
jgi:hypothetical protein